MAGVGVLEVAGERPDRVYLSVSSFLSRMMCLCQNSVCRGSVVKVGTLKTMHPGDSGAEGTPVLGGTEETVVQGLWSGSLGTLPTSLQPGAGCSAHPSTLTSGLKVYEENQEPCLFLL